jgi:anti-sigma factor RsiW
MNEHLGDRLSAYVDGDLDGEALAAAGAHLAGCAECRDAVNDLRRVAGLARALDDRPPTTDLWPGIAVRIGAPRPDVLPLVPRRRRISFSVPQLAAAGLALAALSGGGTIAALRLAAPVKVAVAPAPDASALPAYVSGAAASYDAAVGELEAMLSARRRDLDTATIRTIEISLQVIDAAITQARDALARDPNDVYLNGHLRSTLDRKLELLRRAALLPRAS